MNNVVKINKCGFTGCENDGSVLKTISFPKGEFEVAVCRSHAYRWEYVQGRMRMDSNYLRKHNVNEDKLAVFMCDRVDTDYYDKQWEELEAFLKECDE